MANLKSLLPQASTIRDATVEKENTALRVGTMFVDIISEAADELEGHKGSISNLEQDLVNTKIRVAANKTSIEKLQTAQTETAETLETLAEYVGQPDGIAPLNSDGKVPEEHLPAPESQIPQFEATVTDVQVESISMLKKSSDPGCSVVYSIVGSKFLLKYVGEGMATVPKYYTNWQDADDYGSFTGTGRHPNPSKLYVCTVDNRLYRWDGTNLRPITDGLYPAIRCVDETDLTAKAASDSYAEGQQFYIPETDN